MGGDFAPRNPVEGAIRAIEEHDNHIVLVGRRDQIETELQRHNSTSDRIEIAHAEEYIGMDESPGTALRRKRASSIRIGMNLVRDGQADAFVSAGNTGAVMGGSLLYLRTMPGVAKAAIATFLPTLKGMSIMLDVGANVDCKPEHIFQFAIMGNSYAQYVLGTPRPRVGILSIGEEESKGNDVTRQTFELLRNCDRIDFIGNIEGKEVYQGVADVIVCDGFTGNIALKVSESLAVMISTMLKQELGKSIWGRLGAAIAMGSLKNLKRRLDYTEFGGAPLLGVNHPVFICHGNSAPQTLSNAIRAANTYLDQQVNQHISEDISATLAQLKEQQSARE